MIAIELRGITESKSQSLGKLTSTLQEAVCEMLCLEPKEVLVSGSAKKLESEGPVCIVTCWPGTFDQGYNKNIFRDSYVAHGMFETGRLQRDFTKRLAGILDRLGQEGCKLLVCTFDSIHCTCA